MQKIITSIKGLIKGAAKGGAETTLIPSIIREVGKLKKAKDVYKYGGKFDLNGDGRINLDDIRMMTWEMIGKIAAIGLILYFALRYGVLDELLSLLHAIAPAVN